MHRIREHSVGEKTEYKNVSLCLCVCIYWYVEHARSETRTGDLVMIREWNDCSYVQPAPVDVFCFKAALAAAHTYLWHKYDREKDAEEQPELSFSLSLSLSLSSLSL